MLKLKKIELSKYDILSNESEVQNYIKNISSKEVSEIKSKFENNGLDFQLFFDEIATHLKWQKLIYKIYSDKIKFDPNIIKIELDNLIKNKKKLFNIEFQR